MYKSVAVRLVLLNSVLAVAGCSRTCDADEHKDKQDKQAENGARRTSCHGRGHGGFFFWGGRGIGGAGRAGGGQSGSGSVGRGGFGATGHGVGS